MANIIDIAVCRSHCDWIYERAKELKALFSYDSGEMIVLNKTRALFSISTIQDSLRELSLAINESEGEY